MFPKKTQLNFHKSQSFRIRAGKWRRKWYIMFKSTVIHNVKRRRQPTLSALCLLWHSCHGDVVSTLPKHVFLPRFQTFFCYFRNWLINWSDRGLLLRLSTALTHSQTCTPPQSVRFKLINRPWPWWTRHLEPVAVAACQPSRCSKHWIAMAAGWQNRGNRKGFPFSPVTPPSPYSVTWIPINLSPGTAVGFPHLASVGQLVDGTKKKKGKKLWNMWQL